MYRSFPRRILAGGLLLAAAVVTPLLMPATASADNEFTAFTTGVLGNTVWLDVDFDGVFDPEEIGLEGVGITVSWNSGFNAVATTTGANGVWSVGSLPFDTILTVTVDDADLPGNVAPTADFDDPIGGSISTAHSAQITLTAGSPTNQNLDFGYIGLGSVGDTAWFDVDGDGASAAEVGDFMLEGIDIVVSWTDPVSSDVLEIVATTDNNGFWIVQGLPAGDVVITPDPATLPGGIVGTYDADGGSDGTVTVDLTDNPGTGGIDESTRFDIDFAWTGTGSIGDLVWLDVNADGSSASESGVSATTVELAWNDPISPNTYTFSATTNGSGIYSAPRLPAGPYQVSAPDMLSGGFSPTYEVDGLANGIALVTLPIGANLTTVDFGFRSQADLSIEVTVSQDFRIGETNEFEVVVENLGPGSADAPIQVVHNLPSGMTFDSISGGGAAAWSCAADAPPNANLVRCNFTGVGLSNGSGSLYNLSVDVDEYAVPSKVLSSSISSGSLDAVGANNADTTSVDVPLSDINMTLTRLDPLVAGEVVTYRVALRNDGPSPTSGALTVTNPLPAGLAYDDFSGDGWSCAPNGANVVCINLGIIPVSATSVLDIDLVVTADGGTNITNSVTATGGNNVNGTPLNSAAVAAAVGATADALTETVTGGSGATTTAPTTTGPPSAGATTTTTISVGSGSGSNSTSSTIGTGSSTGSGTGSVSGGQTDLDGDGIPDELARTGLGETLLWFTVLSLSAGAIMMWATRPLRRPRAGQHWGQ